MGADCVMKYHQSHCLLPGVISTFFYNIIFLLPRLGFNND